MARQPTCNDHPQALTCAVSESNRPHSALLDTFSDSFHQVSGELGRSQDHLSQTNCGYAGRLMERQ